jgi:Flp pilus assembly protein TadG
MTVDLRSEHGQTVVEMAIIMTVLLLLTLGLVDVGRAFYQYNAVAASARFGARWASVVGGTCANYPTAITGQGDFCSQLSTSVTTPFWQQAGNAPIQGINSSCPSYTSTPSDYYTASTYSTATSTTIVGAVAQRFDSSSTSTSFISGAVTPGMNLSNLHVCISVTSPGSTQPSPGDYVSVSIYYPFTAVGPLFGAATLGLSAQSQFQVE